MVISASVEKESAEVRLKSQETSTSTAAVNNVEENSSSSGASASSKESQARTNCAIFVRNLPTRPSGEFMPQDSLLVRKFVRRTKSSELEIVNGQMFEKAANFRPYGCTYITQFS